MDIKLSIIIPTYNTPEALTKLIGQFSKEDLKDAEVIVVNDGSLVNYGDFPKFVRYTRLPINKGAVNARFVGWEQARGEYVWFFDSDDQLPAGSVERITEAIGTCDVHVFPMNRQRKTNGPLRILKFKPRDAAHLAYSWYFGNKIFRRKLITSASFDLSCKIFQDENFIMRAGVNVRTIAYHNGLDPIYNYLYNPLSISKTQTEIFERSMNLLANVESLINFVNKLNVGEYRTYAGKQLTRMLTIALGWTVGKGRTVSGIRRRQILSAALLLRRAGAGAFVSAWPWSLYYGLIRFVYFIVFPSTSLRPERGLKKDNTFEKDEKKPE